MNIDVKNPEWSGLNSRFTPAAEPTELRVSELIDQSGDDEMDTIMGSISPRSAPNPF